MPDITMCMNKKCMYNDRCYRYLATPSQYMQSYADFKPNEVGCDYFWPLYNDEVYNNDKEDKETTDEEEKEE